MSIPKVKSVESREPLKLLITKKEIEEDIDLDIETEIPKIDFNIATIEEMRLISQLLEKKARKKQLRSKRDKEYTIIEDAKNIITEAIGVEVDSTQHILLQLEEAVHKFNEDSFGQDKLIEKAKKKFDDKVLEHISQQIAIKQVELAKFLGNFENSFKNTASLFAKLCDVSRFTKKIKDKLNKIDNDMQSSASSLQVNPSSSISHHSKMKYLAALQVELLREEARIREDLI